MENQALAYQLVETVIGARDQGNRLPPALASSWLMLRAELPPAHRVLVQELSGAPGHESDLAFIVGGVEQAFRRDAELKVQFGLLFDELAELDVVELAPPGVGGLDETYLTEDQAAATEESVAQSAPVPAVPDPSPRQQSKSSGFNWPLALGALLLALVAIAVYFSVGGDDEAASTAPEGPVETSRASTSRAARPVDDIFALSPSDSDAVVSYVEIDHQLLPADNAPLLAQVNRLFEERDYRAAITEQKSLIDVLGQQAASPASFADAWSLLAFFYDAAKDPAYAVSCQRRSLEYARKAYDQHDLRLGRVHIALAAYYQKASSEVMARAHLKEGMYIYTQAEAVIAPAELAQANRVAAAVDQG